MSELNFQSLTDHAGKAVKEWFVDSDSPLVNEIVAKITILRMYWVVNKSSQEVVELCSTLVSALPSLGRDEKSARLFLEMIKDTLSYFVKVWAFLLKDGDYLYKLALLVLLADVPLS